MALTFQKCARETSHVGKDKLYGVGEGEHVQLAREGRKVKIMFQWFWLFRSNCFGGSGCFVRIVSVVPVVLFRVFRSFRSSVPGLSTCPFSKAFLNSSSIFLKNTFIHFHSSSKQEFLRQKPKACISLPNRITQLQKRMFGLCSKCSSLAFSLCFVVYLSIALGAMFHFRKDSAFS